MIYDYTPYPGPPDDGPLVLEPFDDVYWEADHVVGPTWEEFTHAVTAAFASAKASYHAIRMDIGHGLHAHLEIWDEVYKTLPEPKLPPKTGPKIDPFSKRGKGSHSARRKGRGR